MAYFVIVVLFLFGLGLSISGSQQLSKDVRTNMAPEDIELITNELTNRKYVGQIILVSVAIILMFHLS